jgi:CubicO group peptidase (beta-lactamase class C family)
MRIAGLLCFVFVASSVLANGPSRGGDSLQRKGKFVWDGAAGTWFFVDPTNDVVFVAMIQLRGGPVG